MSDLNNETIEMMSCNQSQEWKNGEIPSLSQFPNDNL